MGIRSGNAFFHAFNVLEVKRVPADPPVSFFDFVDLHPGDRAKRLTFDTDHDVGDLGDDFLLLFGREHVFDDLHMNRCALGNGTPARRQGVFNFIHLPLV